MKTDTAYEYWNSEWAGPLEGSKWSVPEPMVLSHAAAFQQNARILDLGAGIGRHALALARAGFKVTAVDASTHSAATIGKVAEDEGLDVDVRIAPMTELPFRSGSFDHVLSWNVIYHGEESVVRRAFAEVARVLRPKGTFLFTMLSARRLPVEQAKAPGREISRNTWVFDGEGDKTHPHYFCSAQELLALIPSFEVLSLLDAPHDTPGSWHWHVIAERT